jgi:phosphatidate cytidylyltransferase
MKRIIAGLILVVIFALPTIFGPSWVFMVLALLVVLMCMYELFRVAISPSAMALAFISMIASVPFFILAYRGDTDGCFLTIGVTSVILMITSLFLFEKNRAGAKDLVYSIAGLIYPMALIGFWVLLRAGMDGRFWVIYGLVGVFVSDIGAYYVGKNLGSRKIAPRLSPKKTIEGFIGGICSSIALGYVTFVVYNKVVIAYQIDPLQGVYPLWLLVLLSACIGILDLAGDLTASLFKREFQIKDMGNLIPGHGGMLDRMDGVILVGCVIYCIIKVAA